MSENNEYFEDDEAFLGDDTELFSDDAAAAFKQIPGTVTYEIRGMYDDKGNLKSRWKIRQEPPVLFVTSVGAEDDENTAHFMLTKDFSKQLSMRLDDINKMYYGIDPSKKSAFSQEWFSEKKESISTWSSENSMKLIIGLVVIVGLVLLAILT